MNILDYFYSNSPTIEKFNPRKVEFPKKSSFELIGARATGKSALIVNYLESLRKDTYLYIDCQDPLFILEYLDAENLEQFIKEEKIELLILDHYYQGFLEFLPKVQRVIVISSKKSEFNLPTHNLMPLDFEEFLNFSKNINATSAFNLYTKKGSLPALASSYNFESKAKELFFEKFEPQEGKVMLILALFHTKVTTPNQIYIRAKEYFKISKDWLYSTIKHFEEEGLIYQIKTHEKGFGKKLLLYDFAFSKYLNKHQTFLATIDSIVALALIKHKIAIKALNNPLGYITDSNDIILIAPFDSEDSQWQKHYKNIDFFTNLKVNSVTIVTISTRYQFPIKDITFYAVPFSEWIIMLDEDKFDEDKNE